MATYYSTLGEMREVIPANGVTFTREEVCTLLRCEDFHLTSTKGETMLLTIVLGAFFNMPRNENASRLILVEGVYGDALEANDVECGWVG